MTAPSALPDGRQLQSREIRLAQMALSLYALHLDPTVLVAQPDWAALPRHEVLLRGQPDHALHFLLSAWLSMDGDGAWADLIGLYKVLSDAGSP